MFPCSTQSDDAIPSVVLFWMGYCPLFSFIGYLAFFLAETLIHALTFRLNPRSQLVPSWEEMAVPARIYVPLGHYPRFPWMRTYDRGEAPTGDSDSLVALIRWRHGGG